MKEIVLSDNALQIASSRYFMQGEDWKACATRAAQTIASPETNNRIKIEEQFLEMIYNMDFLPAGRILRNSGRSRGSLFNCYHLNIGDSIEEIGQFIKDSLILWSEGGGVGCNFSSLRPKGDLILGKGGESSGLVSFIEAADAVSHTIESGGARRAAALAHIDVSHPEIINFMNAKLLKPDISKWLKKETPEEVREFIKEKVDIGILNHFNISVSVNDDFLDAVESNKDWKFMFKQQHYGTVKARDIWNIIVKNMITCAEPGIINWTNFSKNNSYYFSPVTGSNPCHTGDTLVAVADGRKLVSFKDLAKEGIDIPVFCLNDKNKKIEIKMMRRPRKTGINQKIFKVFLDNGTSFRCNDIHKVTLFDGSQKAIKDLKVGDRLHHMIKYNANISTILNQKKTKSDYIWMNNGFQSTVAEHRLIASEIIGRKLYPTEVVHHIDYIYDNNSPENLKVMTKKKHDNFHRKDMLGDKNPMVRFPDKNYFATHKFCGIKNGNSKGVSLEEFKSIAINYTRKIGRRPLIIEWKQYCDNNNYPFWIASLFHEYKGYKQFFDDICLSLNIPKMNQYLARSYKKYLEIKDNTDLNIFWEDGIKVIKKCKECKENFIVVWNRREQSLCSNKCVCSYISKFRIEKQKVSANLNFKVIKIEEDGYEDIYNGTVDDHHNFYIFVGDDKTKAGKRKQHFVNSRNCGETTLSPYEACDLGSLVLPNFITGSINTNWKKLNYIIKLAVRFLDNVIDVNKYVLKEIDIKAHQSRRIGLGVLGLAEYLFAKKVRYGSEKAVAETEKLMRFIRDSAYKASVELAIEKGSFPKFESIEYGRASFIRKLPASLRMDIKKYGTRNCTLMALAPTGTISLLTNYMSAIEPLFAKAMIRKDRVSERIYIHPQYQEIISNGEDTPEWFVDSYDLEPKDHFEMQVACQKFCDASVSKTINLPKETTEDDLSSLLLEYIHDLKGVTVYRDGTKPGQVLNKIPDDEVAKYMAENKSINIETNLKEDDINCVAGSCVI